MQTRPIAEIVRQIKSNQIVLLAKAPLIRSTGAPSTGLQLPDMEQYNACKQEVFKKTLKTHNAVKMSIVQVRGSGPL